MHQLRVVSLRLVREKTVPYQAKHLEGSERVYDLFRDLVQDLDRESFWVICLDTKHQVNCLSQISVGSVNATIVRPAEVFKVALMANATSIIGVHNHPSGDPHPSPEDRMVTQQLKAAGLTLGVKLIDHLIIGEANYYSFADQGGL